MTYQIILAHFKISANNLTVALKIMLNCTQNIDTKLFILHLYDSGLGGGQNCVYGSVITMIFIIIIKIYFIKKSSERDIIE